MTIQVGTDTAKTRKTLTVGDQSVAYYSIAAAEAAGLGDFSKLPAALKVVLENMLRFEDGKTVSVDDIRAFADWAAKGGKNPRPGRVLTEEDILHYRRVVTALTETRTIMAEIDKAIEEHGGWPGAFAIGTDADMAQVKVQNRVSTAMPSLPQEVQRQGVKTEKRSTNMLLIVNLYSPDGTFDALYLNNYATINVKDTLGRVKGVGKADPDAEN